MTKFKIYKFTTRIFLPLIAIALLAGCSQSKHANKPSGNTDSKWYDSKIWLNGLQLTPDESINQKEFMRQYDINRSWWDEAFNFLKNHDLINMNPGVYILDSNNVTATITELNPKDKDQVNWEAHRNFNDLQYIINGKAKMGIASLDSPNSTVKVPYDPKTDNENFTITGEKYYDAEPGSFFIFSPNEIHRPAFKVEGYDLIKKIVIKVRVPK